MNEAITWIDVDEQLPDDDTTVLVAIPTEGVNDIWFGYHDDGEWRDGDGGMTIETPTHWAELPSGPSGEAAGV